MTRSEFLLQLQDMLQAENAIDPNCSLADLEEWDSMAIMILIAFFDREFGLQFKFDDVQKCASPEDLIGLANGEIV